MSRAVLAFYTIILSTTTAAAGDPQYRAEEVQNDLARSQKFEALQGLPPASRVRELLKVVRDGEEIDVHYAVPLLIYNDELRGDALEALSQRMGTLSDNTRMVLLGAMRNVTRDESYAPIARDALEYVVHRTNPEGTDREQTVKLVGQASLLLVKSGIGESDAALLRRVVHAFPESFATWIVLAQHGLAGQGECELARKIYENKENLLALRVGAAVACSEDSQARRIALDEIEAFLQQFGTRSLEEQFPNAWSDDTQRSQYARMRRDIAVVALLVAIESPEAQDLAFKYISSPNQEIASLVQLVAARKWPDRVIDSAGGPPSDEAQRVVGWAVFFHPRLRVEAESRIPKAELDEQIQIAKATVDRPAYREAERMIIEWKQFGKGTSP